MGLRTDQKRVILPVYKPTDHTPSVYKDPHSDRLIPVQYFLNNLDDIGPVHWENERTADFFLKIVSCEEVDYCYNNTTQKLNTSSSLPKCNNRNINALEASTITNYFNIMMFNYHQLLLNNFNLQQQQLQNYYQHNNNYDSGFMTPPDSPQREEYYYVITPDNFTKFYENVKFLKLGKEAYDILDSYIAEAEEDGIEIVGEGIIEIY
ncbi:9776_t:CDS:2 [Diversispora eburnea]|uniref:9776_t:CDS:1 n=1 Tax=Diversispora eburnea TaxID=1213867 RepID=A0A9N8VWU9_9GLOM|nr:9776_t:CDS:2 [Diversispora eburnea]